MFPAAGHNGRHPKNWLSGNPTVQPAVQAAGTNLKDTAFDEVGASAVANAQTPQPGNAGPLDDLSAGPFTERVALWLHGTFTRVLAETVPSEVTETDGRLSSTGTNAVSTAVSQ